jgi:hypothetical protein
MLEGVVGGGAFVFSACLRVSQGVSGYLKVSQCVSGSINVSQGVSRCLRLKVSQGVSRCLKVSQRAYPSPELSQASLEGHTLDACLKPLSVKQRGTWG